MRKLLSTMMMVLGIAIAVAMGTLCDSLDAGTRLGNVKCLSLNGSGYASHADTDELDLGVSDGVLEAWIKTTSADKQPIIYKSGTGGYYDFHINVTTGYLECEINDGTNTATITGDVAVNDGDWHHVVCVLDKSSATGGRLYVDGTEDASAQTDLSSVGDIDNDGVFYVGYDGTDYFTGRIALGNVWNEGYGGLPTASGTTLADYAAWRKDNPYADFAAHFANGAWVGYADADRTELVTNGDFESDPDGTSPPTGWIYVRTPTTYETDDVQAHGGTKSYKIVADGDNEGARFNPGNATNVFYELSAWMYHEEAAAKTMAVGLNGVGETPLSVSPSTWTKITYVAKDIYGAGILMTNKTSGAMTFWVDDVSVKRTGNVLKCDLDGDYTDDTSNALDLTEGGSGNEFLYSTIQGTRLEGGVGKTILK